MNSQPTPSPDSLYAAFQIGVRPDGTPVHAHLLPASVSYAADQPDRR